MENIKNVKIVVFIPTSHAQKVRDAMSKAGAGRIGNYTHCSISSIGIGRFKPEGGASPAIGEMGKLEQVEEERVEAHCSRKNLSAVIRAIKGAHPYEEVALDVYSLENLE